MVDTSPRENRLVLFIRERASAIVLGVLILIGLFLVSRVNYLLFHALVELFSVVISITIFVLVWSSRSFIENRYLMVLGIASLFIGLFDLLHTLSYQGMGVFPGTQQGQANAANLATQLWLAARYVQSITMAIAPLLFLDGRQMRVRPGAVLAAYLVVTAALLFAIYRGIFPDSLLDATGLTPFKIASEYIIILFFIIGFLLIFSKRLTSNAFDRNVRNLLALSIILNVLAEIAFTGYLQVMDFINLAGHFFKVGAVYLIYEAIIVTGLLRPYSLLFRELAQREKAQRASEARERARAAEIEALMDVVPAIVWIAHDPGARNVTGNRASAELLKLPPNANHSRYLPEVSERFQFFDVSGNELTLDTLPLHLAAATGKSVRNFQQSVISKEDGTERHLYGSIIPLLDENGQPEGAVGAFTDITARVHAEQELRRYTEALHESEQRYRSLFEGMAEGFGLFELLYDEQGQPSDYLCYEINPAFEQMFGITREQMVGKKRSVVSQDSDVSGGFPVWVRHFAGAVQSGKPARVEDYSHLADKYLEVLVNPIEGNFFATLTVDITERRRSQEALRQSEARLRRLVDSNIIGIIYSRGGGNVTLANDALLEIIGYTHAEFKSGQIDWNSITPVEYLPLDKNAMAEVAERGACTPYEKEFIRKDGTRVPVLAGYAYFADDEMAPYVGFILDLTPQKRAEDAVREYAAQLERSNRELQDFAFVASHDLQEPLRKIQAFGERVRERMADRLDENTRDYMERMLNAAVRMRAMINDLLSLSRVTTQGQPFQRVALNEVAQEVLSDLETRIERSRGKIEVDDLPEIEADPLQMHQLFQNLISNALKFHQPDQPPSVRVYAECLKDSQQVRIYVEDDGIGFDDQYLDRIFQPFQRLHGMSQYEGSGMGLAICRKIVERHSGAITARSIPGEGTTFLITLPMHPPHKHDS